MEVKSRDAGLFFNAGSLYGDAFSPESFASSGKCQHAEHARGKGSCKKSCRRGHFSVSTDSFRNVGHEIGRRMPEYRMATHVAGYCCR